MTKPGKILAAYSLFHNSSLANAMLALIEFEMHGIRPGPINTFPEWKPLGACCAQSGKLANDEEDPYCNRNGGRGTSGQVDVPPPLTEPETTTC